MIEAQSFQTNFTLTHVAPKTRLISTAVQQVRLFGPLIYNKMLKNQSFFRLFFPFMVFLSHSPARLVQLAVDITSGLDLVFLETAELLE